MKNIFYTAVVIFSLVMSPITAVAQAASGGTYTLEQSVIAGGGGQQSNGGTFSLDGTIGQSVAGGGVQKYPYILQSGFWNSSALLPTAAAATIEGRIKTADGRGVRNVIISLTDATTNETRSTRSTAFGYYRFEEVVVGQTYILTASAKRYTFNPNTRAISLLEDLADEDFVALPVGK